MTNKIYTHYDNLKVSRNAPPEVIKAAYKALGQRYHPDKDGGDERIFKIIKDSYEVLIDPDRRAAHDQWIRQQESGGAYSEPAYEDEDDDEVGDCKEWMPDAPPAPKKKKTGLFGGTRKLDLIIGGAMLASFVVVVDALRNDPSSIKKPTAPQSVATSQNPNDYQDYPVCDEYGLLHGGVSWQDNVGEKLAPLSFKTNPGTNYLVKMVNLQTGLETGYFYIQGGMPFKTDVPLGKYEIRYASGKNWCNSTVYFGAETVFSKADQPFEFTYENGQYMGYEVELILQARGNLNTPTIDRSAF